MGTREHESQGAIVAAAEILVGTCNWLDHEAFYPEELRGKRQKERLSFYARFFPIVEIDSSFYGIPKPPIVQSWVDRTGGDFRFNIKAYRSLTGHEREAGKARRPTADEERDFLECLKPLRDADRLVAVHYQFPPWFTNRPSAREWLLETRDRHPADTVAIEFRHRSWFDEGRWPETEDLLRELDLTFVGVDAPQVGSGTAPPHLAITSPKLSIIRFHGRNRATWYKKATTTAERFDYLYRPRELEQWVPTIKAAAAHGVPVHVLMNNNRSNYAVVNAFDMAHLLDLTLPRPPPPIIESMRAREGRVPAWVAGALPAQSDDIGDQDGQLSLDVATEE